MKTIKGIFTCLLLFFCSNLAFGDDMVVTFKDNREQRFTLSEPSCNIKSIVFYTANSSTSGTPPQNTSPIQRITPTTPPGSTPRIPPQNPPQNPPPNQPTNPQGDCKSYPIKVTSAKYGLNCKANYNVTRVASDCDGKTECSGAISNSYAGTDPAPGCPKDFTITYSCGGTAKREYVPAKKDENSPWSLSCKCVQTSNRLPNAPNQGPVIKVTSAKYGANCKVNHNVTRVAGECDGKSRCSGKISNAYAGTDPAPGCAKDFTILYSCGGTAKREYVPAKWEEGNEWTLSCP